MSLINIQKEMLQNGFNPPDTLSLDGKIHRYGDENVNWYIGYQNIISTGEVFFVILYSSWKISERFKYQSGIKIDRFESAKFKAQFESAQRIADAERGREWERVSAICVRLWEELEPAGIIPYLQGKRIEGLYGAKTRSELHGRILYIPMRDEEKKLWSFQKIFPGTFDKRFETGGRKQGCFHVIGEELEHVETIYIAEGFATAASIHLAIRKPVVVAFDSGNLEPVSLALRKKYPDKSIIICGDDDVYNEKNVGREKAEHAAKLVLGSACFPTFATPATGKTDFNDLHQSDGLPAVRDQIEKQKTVKTYIDCLGFNNDLFFIRTNHCQKIQSMSSSLLMKISGLCWLQPLEYWESAYPKRNTESGGVDVVKAGNDIMVNCLKRGIFSPEKARGIGFWDDHNKIVYHQGEKLYFDSLESPLHKPHVKSKYIYELGDAMPVLNPACGLNLTETEFLIQICQHIRWKKPDSAKLLSGWLALAPIGGYLDWRPHIWIYGARGGGKTYVINDIINSLLKNFRHYFKGSGTTEAGIRQDTAKSSLPILIDEFEGDKDKTAETTQAVLELARQASSKSDAVIVKGSSGGKSQSFNAQFMMCVGSIGLNLKHEADVSRFAALEIAGVPEKDKFGQNKQFTDLENLVAQIPADFSIKLASRSFKLANEITQSAKVFQKAIAGLGHPMRTGQQYGALLAGYWSLQSDVVCDEISAISIIQNMDFSVADDANARGDEFECLEYLLDKSILVEYNNDSGYSRRQNMPIRQTLSELVNNKGSKDDFVANDIALQQIGILFDSIKKVIWIGRTHNGIKKIFQTEPKFKNSFAKRLERIPETLPNERIVFPKIDSSRRRCLGLKLSSVFSDD